jgi:hypothetical protein
MSYTSLNFLRQFAILTLVLASDLGTLAHAEKTDKNKPIV